MVLDLDITYRGDEYNIVTKPIDIVAYSDAARRNRWPSNPEDDRARMMCYTAYHAMHRLGKVSQETTFNDFMADLDNVMPHDDEQEEEPFTPMANTAD